MILALICLFGFQRPTPPALFLPSAEPKPTLVQNLIEYGWFWLQFHLPGRRQSVLLRAKVFRFDRYPAGLELSLPAPAASTNGLHLWLLPDEQSKVLNKALEQIPGAEVVSQPGIQMLGAMRGSMAAGNTVVIDGVSRWAGVELSSLPKIRKDYVDLTSRLAFTELTTNAANRLSLRTNLAVRSRVQIPKGGAAFVLGNTKDGKTIAALISARVQ